MIEFEDLPVLENPIMICAFEGWNDAAESASGVISHLRDKWNAELLLELDPEEYYDYQVNRPHTYVTDSGERGIVWPGTRIYSAHVPELSRDVVLVAGIEPNIKWPQFIREILGVATELDTNLVLTLGALLSDNPHTRPVPVSATTNDPQMLLELDVERSTYEGPTGIVGAIASACEQFGIPSLSLWASVPHYVGQSPCPKASLALVTKIEELLDLPIPLGDLTEDARAWEAGVNELARDDEEIADYVAQLEEEQDTAELPEASGDAIAKEFERYLRRRER
ncbi:MAG: PAC2 family protein [Candidatus Nanopelagicales bacterium]|nr:PAC2 family protein [Actinomycetota bacterium]MDC1474518.1 PAC2 family protein [Candidatus Nanopelagicales bacterium]MBT5182702.1 PAC2 family protein [Actinomycetota bacterium]MBT5502366.1 PAC2 family protein [Actinomycetota bacterium]MBT5806326.1 PAC2 family protein [Actinomycetota bacterium]